MSDMLLVAIIVSIPPTLAAILTYRATKQVARKADEIHVLTNSNLALVKANLEAANEEILALRQQIAALTAELGG